MGSLKIKIKKFIIQLIPLSIKRAILSETKEERENSKLNVYYSHEGEDIILQKYFFDKKEGFYIDIGAHHPTRFSNTYLFYLKGWKGINIDAMPHSMRSFNQIRPRDNNLEIAVSDKKEDLTYYMFNEPALNTFSEKEAEKKNGLREYKIIRKVILRTHPLSIILDQYLPQNTPIDFLNIDVEGLDFAVLKSNDWNKYRPTIIVIESLNTSLEQITKNKIYCYLKKVGYVFIAKTANTLFFKKS